MESIENYIVSKLSSAIKDVMTNGAFTATYLEELKVLVEQWSLEHDNINSEEYTENKKGVSLG